MPSLWEKVKKSVKEGVTVAADKTEEYTRIGKIKLDIAGLNRKREKQFAELGEKVYHLFGEKKAGGISQDKGVKDLVAGIKALEDELEEKKKKIEEIKAEGKEGAEPAE